MQIKQLWNKRPVWLVIPICAGLVLLLTALTCVFVDYNSLWYASLVKPTFLPPAAVFAVGWTLLFFIYCASFALCALLRAFRLRDLMAYTLGALLSPLWCYLFFTLHQLLGALLIIGAQLALQIFLFCRSWHISRIGAWLMIPCIVWTVGMVCINFETAFLN